MEDEEITTVINMIDSLKATAKNCERIIQLLQPEFDNFNKTGSERIFNQYAVRMYVDHKSSLRVTNKEISALENIIHKVKGNSDVSNKRL